MKPVIEIKNLRTYLDTPSGTSRAVDGVSFHIKKGETFAIVGESGCGKSMTALSVIQLVPEPQGRIESGKVILDGTDIVDLPEREKRNIRGNEISMIFQEPMTSLNPVFTVGEQVAEAIRLHQKKDSKEARVVAIEMLSLVGLDRPDELYDDYPHRLSGGMRQRVMIAMALACRPALLIADEPTTALDVTIQDQILNLIGDLQKELGTAVLLITHNLGVVYKNAERIAVMYAGKIVEEGLTKKIFRNPMHPYTLKLLRSIPGIDKRGKALDTIPGTVPPATDYNDGCRFAGRCPREMASCVFVEPELREPELKEAGSKETHSNGTNSNDNGPDVAADAHLVACHLYNEDFMSGNGAKPVARKSDDAKALAPLKGNGKVVLDVKGLKCHYPVRKGIFKKIVGFVKAVDGIDLTLKKGSTLALVGESGCGKTTAGKSIIQLLRPTSGEVLFNGEDLTKLSDKKLREHRSLMQFIFQDPYSSLNPRMMVGEIIEEGIKSLKPHLDKDERTLKIAEALDKVGLTSEMKSRYPHEFSGGQRQRIGIARVLAVDPEFIICDEATSALDVSVQAQILNLLKSIQRDFGISFLFITHDLGVVEYIADEVAVMKDGVIVERGTVEQIFNSPKDNYTKTLLAAVPRIREHGKKER